MLSCCYACSRFLLVRQFIPLPFLLFASGRLRTANAGARVLLGLADDSLERYSLEDIFPTDSAVPPSEDAYKAATSLANASQEDATSTKSSKKRLSSSPGTPPYKDLNGKRETSVRSEGGLQHLVARVQSSQEPLALKAAVYTSETDGTLKSILIVDISPAPSRKPDGEARVHSEDGPADPSASVSFIPSIIKRHSGDIRKYFSGASQHVHTASPSQPLPVPEEVTEDGPGDMKPPHFGRRTTVMARQDHQDDRSTPVPRDADRYSNQAVASRNNEAPPSFNRTRSGTAHRQKSNISLRSHPRDSDSAMKTGLTPPDSPLLAGQQPPLPRMGTNNSDQSSGGVSSGFSGRSNKRPSSKLHLPLDGIDYSLAHAALAAHPRTGVMISKSDLSSGFINSRTRELLMGLKSPEGETTSDPFDDMWFAPSAGKERTVVEEPMAGPSGSPLWEDEIIFEDGKVRIDLPDRGFNMQTSVSDILKWSLRRRKLRQHHRVLRDDVSVSSGMSVSPPPSLTGVAPSSASASMYNYRGGMTAAETRTFLDSLQSERPWLTHKPYKVYDAAFTQRAEDPFEALFDQCIRKNECDPSGSESVTVGIETEVGPADKCAFPESECFTYMAENTDPSKGEGLVPVRVRRRIVQARAAPLRDMNGDHIGGVVWLRDITGEMGTAPTTPSVTSRDASHPLQLVPSVAAQTSAFLGMPMGNANAGSDPFWQQIVNSMPQMVWVTKPDGSHIYFNNKWYSFTGLQPEQSLGVNWQNPFHPDDMPASRRHWSRSLATGEPYSVEYRCRRHDGVWRWQLGRAQALFDAHGKIIAWFGTCTDVEEFVQMRTQLAETSQNLRRVIDLASITLCCVGRDLKVLFLEGGGALKHHGYEDYKSRSLYRYDDLSLTTLCLQHTMCISAIL